jgi:sugar/nucleoside kinase (ribokinase family)
VARSGPFGATSWFPASAIEKANPIGAGDAFAAALGLKLEVGSTLDDAVSFAIVTAAAHVECLDGEFHLSRASVVGER